MTVGDLVALNEAKYRAEKIVEALESQGKHCPREVLLEAERECRRLQRLYADTYKRKVGLFGW